MERIAALRGQLDGLRQLQHSLVSAPNTLLVNGSVKVYLGDGYFADMDVESAKGFVQRRADSVAARLDRLCEIQGVTEDGLPIMDIHEELDEDGNVINSRVEKTGGGIEQMARALRDSAEAQAAAASSTPAAPPAAAALPRSQTVTRAEQTPTITEITDDSALVDTPRVSERGPALAARSSQPEFATEASVVPVASDSASQRFEGISREDILELQLLGDQIDNLDVDSEEDVGDLDMGEEDIDDDGEDDDDESGNEDAFGRTRGSLFPTNDRVQALLRMNLANHGLTDDDGASDASSNAPSTGPASRQASPRPSALKSSEETSEDKHQRSVHFGAAPDIKEFETSSQERLDPQFGGDAIYDGKQPRRVSFDTAVEVCEFETTSEERLTPLWGGKAVEDVIERGDVRSTAEQAPSDSPGLLRGKVTREPLDTAPLPVRSIEDSANNFSEPSEPVADVLERAKPADTVAPRPPQPPKSKQYKGRLVSKSTRGKVGVATPLPRPGVADPAVPPEFQGTGIVRPEDDDTAQDRLVSIKDLDQDALVYFDQATIPDEDFVRLHADSYVDDDDEEPAARRLREKPNQPLMTGVVEKAESSTIGDAGDEEETGVNMTEVRREYQRLRQKFVQRAGGYSKTEGDQETEPVDEDGNPVRVSRFKAARMGLR